MIGRSIRFLRLGVDKNLIKSLDQSDGPSIKQSFLTWTGYFLLKAKRSDVVNSVILEFKYREDSSSLGSVMINLSAENFHIFYNFAFQRFVSEKIPFQILLDQTLGNTSKICVKCSLQLTLSKENKRVWPIGTKF